MRKIDPIVWFLDFFFQAFLGANLDNDETVFVQANINKHRKALWINVFASVFVFLGVRDTSKESILPLVTSLLGVVAVTGIAWYTISFGRIPKKLMNVAMLTTFYMFVAFLVSLTSSTLVVASVVSVWFWPVLALIYLFFILASIYYDTADGFQSGQDALALKGSRYAIEFFKAQGVRLEGDDSPPTT
jgi:hypothetical protein